MYNLLTDLLITWVNLCLALYATNVPWIPQAKLLWHSDRIAVVGDDNAPWWQMSFLSSLTLALLTDAQVADAAVAGPVAECPLL
jgi:hypothetical protein